LYNSTTKQFTCGADAGAGGGITALGPIGQYQNGSTQTLATSTSNFNGLTAGVTIVGSGNTQTFTPSLSGTLTVSGGGTGATTFGAGEILVGNGTGAVTATSTANLKTTLALNNVENIAFSTWAGSTNLTTLGTITSGTWQGTPIADGYITKTGNWSGTFDGQEGSYYLNRTNHTGTQLASTISDFSSTARGLLSSSALGLAYDSGTGVFSLTAGYTIPLTASTTEWHSAYQNRITAATYPLVLSANTLSLAFGTTTSNTWAGTQTFTNAPVLSSLTNGLLYANGSGQLASVSTSTWTFASSTLLADNNTWSGTNAFGVLSATYASTTQIGSTGSAYFATSGGNVGVGTSAPTQKLHVDNGRILVTGSSYVANPTGAVFGQYDATTGYVQAPANGKFQIWDDTTSPIATFADNGNVGIGTTTPNAKLHISQGASGVTPGTSADELFIEGSSASNVGVTIGAPDAALHRFIFANPSAAQTAEIRAAYNSGSPYLAFFTNGNNQRLTIDAAGNVGIGTTSPTYKLSVVSDTTNKPAAIFTGGSSVGTASAFSGQILLSSSPGLYTSPPFGLRMVIKGVVDSPIYSE
jgi:hypothetical protein